MSAFAQINGSSSIMHNHETMIVGTSKIHDVL